MGNYCQFGTVTMLSTRSEVEEEPGDISTDNHICRGIWITQSCNKVSAMKRGVYPYDVISLFLSSRKPACFRGEPVVPGSLPNTQHRPGLPAEPSTEGTPSMPLSFPYCQLARWPSNRGNLPTQRCHLCGPQDLGPRGCSVKGACY